MVEEQQSYAARFWARLDGPPDPAAYWAAAFMIVLGVLLGFLVAAFT